MKIERKFVGYKIRPEVIEAAKEIAIRENRPIGRQIETLLVEGLAVNGTIVPEPKPADQAVA